MRRGAEGFTVIELVMAMAISALILTVVYSSFNSAEQVRSKITVGNRAHHVVRVISSRIGRELQSLQFRTGDPDTHFSFGLQSGVQSLEFSSSASTPLASQPGLPSQIIYRLRPAQEDEAGPMVLERSEQSALTVGTPRPLRLVDGISALTFRFFADGAWTDEWDSARTGSLPQAVGMTFEREGDGPIFQTSWPIAAFRG
ncbi:MAG: prepilin-type N-terminal cleavage/methylation domain-containing protein [Desulfuromonadales bacterium]|nr:prepilin-type N-terminal cleavage/methylation domain-containing protein [Desulfuromonadales bacterium]